MPRYRGMSRPQSSLAAKRTLEAMVNLYVAIQDRDSYREIAANHYKWLGKCEFAIAVARMTLELAERESKEKL